MLKKIKKRGFVAVLIFLGLFSAFSALAISFTNDVKMDLTGLTSEVYVNGDPTGSQCDSLTVSGANLIVSGIPNGNPFTLENVSDVVLLRLTPSGATGSFSLTSANVSGGYIIQWSTASAVLINYIVRVPLANTNYAVNVNAVPIAGSPFNSGASAQLSFGYTGAGVFTVAAAAVVPPTLTTSAATNILTTSATLNGNITNTGGENALERGFDWGTSPGVYSGSGTTLGSYGTGAFIRGITGLTASTTYYFRSKARNSAGWAYGTELSFTTAAAAVVPPTLTTSAATNILTTSATLNGNITNTGGENALERGFDWGTSPGVYSGSGTTLGSYGTGAFIRGITGLTASTTYYFRSKARNSAGWAYGPELSFTTAAIAVVPPTLTTSAATNILTTSATLNGNITNTGGENALERGFDWGTSPGVYSGSGTTVGSYGVGAFTRGITGLTASTTYYFRSKARNSAGWAYGTELSFTTAIDTTCQNHEIWGYAYSENISWISFSCPTIGAGVNYGVDIDEINSRLYGYAWSENIGWISFTNTDLVGCPSGTCAANINMTTGALAGWARALAPVGRPLSETGGWDGWIKLNGSNYGVTLNSGPNPSEFQGWAWGGDPNNDNNEAVIGLISFNGDNVVGGADYAVYTNLSVNNAPTALISCNPATCSVYHTEVLVLNNDSTDSEGNITQSEWATSKPPAGYIIRQTCGLPSPLCDMTPQNYVGVGLAGVGDYIARLIVTDAGGLSSTDTQAFSILRDATAGFRCSLDNITWENCDTIIPIAGELVYFIDNQAIDPNEYSQASQGGSPIISREWRRDGVVFSAGNNTNPSVISLSPSMNITLTITDSAFPSARTNTRLHTIGSIVLDLPTWNEIAPF